MDPSTATHATKASHPSLGLAAGPPAGVTPRKGRRSSITDMTPSGKAKSLLAGLVMTPPRTPPPSTPGRRLSPRAVKEGRIQQLHIETHASASAAAAAEAPRRQPAAEVEEKKGERERDEPVLGEGGLVVHEGWLLKLKQKNKFASDAKWGRRWFQIREGFLLYFRTQSSRFPAGWLRLSQITSVVDTPTDSSIPGTPITPPYCFKITLASRVLYMQAQSKEEVIEWKHLLQPAPTTPTRTKAVVVGKTKLPPLVAARLPASPPPASASPLRSPLKPGFFKEGAQVDDDSEAAGAGSAGPVDTTGTGADIVPSDAMWVKCFDTENEATYYIHVQTDISTWEIPIADADGGHWVKCFDFEAATVFYAHTRTRTERYQDTIPTDEPSSPKSAEEAEAVTWNAEAGVDVTDTWAAPESGLVWVEGWDDAAQLPYYVRFDTGESQWEWPETEGAQIIQYGSEDYAWYWQWLGAEQGEAATAAEAGKDEKATDEEGENMFGNCFG